MDQTHNLMESLNQQPAIKQDKSQQRQELQRLFKAIVCAILVGGFLAYRFSFPNSQVNCIKDAYQDVTRDINRDMVQHPDRGGAFDGKNDNDLSTLGKTLIGIGQVLMDLWIGTILILWIWKSKNGRLAAAVSMFFLTRSAIFLNAEQFPFPEDIVWRSPGFISFTVPYDHTRDFFYSGHTGSLTIIFLQLLETKRRILTILCGISWLFMVNMLLISRVHYMIDIAGGLIFAIWYYRLAIRIVFWFDKLLCLPFFAGRWVFTKLCRPEVPQPHNQIIVPVVSDGLNLQQPQTGTRIGRPIPRNQCEA